MLQNARKAERFSFRKKPKHPGPVSAILHVTGDSLRVVENRSVYERIPVLSKDDHSVCEIILARCSSTRIFVPIFCT